MGTYEVIWHQIVYPFQSENCTQYNIWLNKLQCMGRCPVELMCHRSEEYSFPMDTELYGY
jgi:hypothetical protein